MKFIRDIIGEKQIQSKAPNEALYDGQVDPGLEGEEEDEWSLPPIDLSEGLDEAAPDPDSPVLDAPADAELPQEEIRATERPRPSPAPEASVIRRALWPDSPEPEVPGLHTDVAPETERTGQDATPPRFGRQAYLDAVPEERAEHDVPPPDPAPTSGGRVKTRLLGFSGDMAFPADPIQRPSPAQSINTPSFPVGWLVIVSGPGRGTCFTLQSGVAQIGRGAGQAIRLDFGDTSISRENHAAIAFDPERSAFFIGHGGKANLVRCNDMPVLATQELAPGDRIRIGETTLLFTPLCGPDFTWDRER